VYESSFVDIAVAILNAAVRGATEQAIPRGYSCKSKFPHWFSYNLRYYIAKKFISTVVLKRNLPFTFTIGSPITQTSSKAPSSPTGLDG
jgi:hypothetical protein